jgi:hypothetical protein
MNKTHLTQLWQWLSIACVLFLVTSVISLQGGSEYLGGLFGEKPNAAAEKRSEKLTADSKPAIGYFGAIVGGGLFLLASSALLLHARRHGDRWHARIPVIWLEGLNTSAWDAKVFQAVILLVFVGSPAAGIFVCIRAAESGDICEQDTNNFYTGRDTSLLWAPVAKRKGNQMRLRRAEADSEPCDSGIELFPRSLTPLGVYGLPVAAGCMAAMAIVSVFMRRKRGPPASADEAA